MHIALFQADRHLLDRSGIHPGDPIFSDVGEWSFLPPYEGQWTAVEINVPAGSRVEKTVAGDWVLCTDESDSGIDASDAYAHARRGERGLSFVK